jgi:hypothetical protein
MNNVFKIATLTALLTLVACGADEQPVDEIVDEPAVEVFLEEDSADQTDVDESTTESDDVVEENS